MTRLLVVPLIAMMMSGLGPPVVAGQAAPPLVPLGEVATAGPWRLQVVEVILGESAATSLAAVPGNPALSADEQATMVELTATNGSDRTLTLDQGDFALVGDGWEHRGADLSAPDPPLAGSYAAGESRTGYVALTAPADATPAVLLFDSLNLPGTWADMTLGLVDGAVVPVAAASGAPSEAGTDVEGAVAISEAVATGSWSITVAEVVVGDPVYELYPASDYRTTALGRTQAGDLGDADGDGAAGWVAVRVSVTYTGTSASGAYLPADAFTLAQSDGSPLPNGLFLTAPAPEAEGWFLPGQTREGWLTFEIQIDWDTDAMRFQAHGTDADVRYLLIY